MCPGQENWEEGKRGRDRKMRKERERIIIIKRRIKTLIALVRLAKIWYSSKSVFYSDFFSVKVASGGQATRLNEIMESWKAAEQPVVARRSGGVLAYGKDVTHGLVNCIRRPAVPLPLLPSARHATQRPMP